MDTNVILDSFAKTLDPEQREVGEKQLNLIAAVPGFPSALLQIVVTDGIDENVKQAAAVYLKNRIDKHWPETSPVPPETPMAAEDCLNIRINMVNAIIISMPKVRKLLAEGLLLLLRKDFPDSFDQSMINQLMEHVLSEDLNIFHGALTAFYQLVKVFEYKKLADRQCLKEPMAHILPLLRDRAAAIISSEDQQMNEILRYIIKIFCAYSTFMLETSVLTHELVTSYLTLCHEILKRPIPAHVEALPDKDDQQSTVYWKVKKWCMNILWRTFDRYGSPGNVSKQYKEFSEWYLKAASPSNLAVVFHILQEMKSGKYVSSKVLQPCYQYLKGSIVHSFTWKLIKPHLSQIIEEIIFPMMFFSEEDSEIWQEDPVMYINDRNNAFGDTQSLEYAAEQLIEEAVTKRKDVLNHTMAFVIRVLNDPNKTSLQIDAAFHFIQIVAPTLLEKRLYKNRLEDMLANYVFPQFASPVGYVRARCCMLLSTFDELRFKKDENCRSIVCFLKHSLFEDPELIVRYYAANALQYFCQVEGAKKHLNEDLKRIVLEMLKLIKETENEDATIALQSLISFFSEEIVPIAGELTKGLCESFTALMEESQSEDTEDKVMTGMTILQTITTVLEVLCEQKDLISALEEFILPVVATIFEKKMDDFYEDIFQVLEEMTREQISANMWQVFHHICDMLSDPEQLESFNEMMPALHNFITVDPAAFASNPSNMDKIYQICKAILNSDSDKETECYAAKMSEVIILQYHAQFEQVIPLFIELVLERLSRHTEFAELRIMLMQVVIAAFYFNPSGMCELLSTINRPFVVPVDEDAGAGEVPVAGQGNFTRRFFSRWLKDFENVMGIHDRKLGLLGLCMMLSQPQAARAQLLSEEEISKLMPSVLKQFEGLQKAYQTRKDLENMSEEGDEYDEDEDDDDDEVGEATPAERKKRSSTKHRPGANDNELDSDEDEVDEETSELLDRLDAAGETEDLDDEDIDYIEDDFEETDLEYFETILDKPDCEINEYVVFKQTFERLANEDPDVYSKLIAPLTKDQQESLKEVLKISEQKAQALASKQLEKSGGFKFSEATAVPSTFDFGFSSPPQGK